MIEQFKAILSNSDDCMDLILWIFFSMLIWGLIEVKVDDFIQWLKNKRK